MNRNLPPLALPLLLLAAFAVSSCASSNNSPQSTPTLSAASATATEADIDGTIVQMVWDYLHIANLTIGRTIHYTDAAGTNWVRFDADTPDQIAPAGPQAGPTGAFSGIMNMAGGGKLDLFDLGLGDIQCGAPADVETGLGFDVCPASEAELDKAIRDYIYNGSAPAAQDVKISRKAYYTDSSGTDWVEFKVLGIPHRSDPLYGFAKRVPGGNWEGVNRGTGAVECGLPEDVQIGLGFPYCPLGFQ